MGITRQQALDCFASDDLIGIGMEADAVRRKLHPEGVVSYVLDRAVSCTGSETTFDALHDEVREALELGCTGVLLQNSIPPVQKVDTLEGLFTGIKQQFPQIWLQGLNASEVLALAEYNTLDLRTLLERFHGAGLNAIASDDLGTPKDDWLRVHRTAHQIGMPTVATMLFGVGETVEQRIDHLEQLRQLQEETGGFTALLPVSMQPFANAAWEEPTAVEFLQTLAISRMYLDNIENVQSSWTMQGLKVLQMGLRFGSNDAGSILPGKSGKTTEEELRRIIRDAGFKPVQRDTVYRTMFLN